MFSLKKTLFLIFTACLLSSALYSTIINVPVDQSTIQAGINASANTDTVLVQPGTYVENINFNGKLITLASKFLTIHDSSYISTTIIDGNAISSVVIFDSGENSSALLTGFTIRNGTASMGGGIFCEDSSPSLDNVIISDNYASVVGGGIYCDSSDPNLQNLTIKNNSANSNGGGIYLNASQPNLDNVIISDNYASLCS